MKSRLLFVPLLGASWAVFGLAMVWPTLALVGRCVTDDRSPDTGYTFSPRQLGLLGRSAGLSAVAAGLCLIVSLPAAYGIGRARRCASHPLIAALLMAWLLCPPMVYAFGWERLLPATFDARARCVGVWALWTLPIPAMLIGAGWSRMGRGAHEAALLVLPSPSAFVRVVVPVLLRYVGLAMLVVFLLCFSDYGVPHACGVLVYPTELLGWAEASSRTSDTLLASLPSVVVTSVALIAMFLIWQRCVHNEQAGAPHAIHPDSSRRYASLVAAGFVAAWLLPVGTLVAKLASPGLIVQAWNTYAHDLAWSLAVAGASGFIVVAMGLGVSATRRWRTVGLVWAVAFGALPGALIGEALVAAYNRSSLWWIYDLWPIVLISYVARFGWVGVLTAMLVDRQSPPLLTAQARIDGASRASILGRIQWPMSWPTLLCGAGVVTALSVADVATSSMVRVPSFAPIAHVLIEKFHRFEDGMLISLSLWLVAAVIPAAVIWAIALGRKRAT